MCVSGLTKDKFTSAQFYTLRDLCDQIHAELPVATFHGHFEVYAKSCPVFDYRWVLGLDAKGRLA